MGLSTSKQTEKTVHEQLKEVGCKLDSHESDLYVKDCTEAKVIIGNWEFYDNVTRFRSQIDNCLWYNLPFANNDWWAKRATNSLR